MKYEVNKYSKEHRIAIEGFYDTVTKRYNPFTSDERVLFKANDSISHFICRLAYCRNDELRKWFLTQETRLFNLRLRA
jgi:DNA primase large subunit